MGYSDTINCGWCGDKIHTYEAHLPACYVYAKIQEQEDIPVLCGHCGSSVTSGMHWRCEQERGVERL